MPGTSSTVRLILLLVLAACHRTRGAVPPAPPSYVVGPAGTTCTSLGLSPVSGPEECRAAAGTYEVRQLAQTTGYAGEWSDGDGEDRGYPHGCHTSFAATSECYLRMLPPPPFATSACYPGCWHRNSGCHFPDVRWNNAEHTPGYSGYHMGRPVCSHLPARARPRIVGAVFGVAVLGGAIFGVAVLGIFAGLVLYCRLRNERINGGRRSRNLQLSQCDDAPDAAPARDAPSQAPVALRVLAITRGRSQERARLTGAAASDSPDEPPPYPGPDPSDLTPDEQHTLILGHALAFSSHLYPTLDPEASVPQGR